MEHLLACGDSNPVVEPVEGIDSRGSQTSEVILIGKFVGVPSK